MKNTDMGVSRAAEMYRESEYAVAVTDFLSPGEKAEIYHELVARIGNGISRCFSGADAVVLNDVPRFFCQNGIFPTTRRSIEWWRIRNG